MLLVHALPDSTLDRGHLAHPHLDPLRPPQHDARRAHTVSAPEIQRLKKRFMKLDRDGSGTIDKDEFLQIPQIATNPLASRMIAIFDEECVGSLWGFDRDGHGEEVADEEVIASHSGGGTVDFQEFVAGLSAFSSRGERDEKLKCASLPFLPCATSEQPR